MKAQTTKLGALVFLGLGLVAYGQTTGRVGINSPQPQATLEVKPKASNLAGTTNEGIIAPQLSKERVANIETPVEGTLVYVVDDADKGGLISAYNGTDPKVAKITEKGYYYFNGTEWVKSAGHHEWGRKQETSTEGKTYDLSYLTNTANGSEVTYNKQAGAFYFLTKNAEENRSPFFIRWEPVNVNNQKEEKYLYGAITASIQTQANTSFSELTSGIFGLTVNDNSSVDKTIGTSVLNNYTESSVNKESIGLYARANIYRGATLGNHTGVYSYVAATAPKTFNNLYYFRTGQQGGYKVDNIYGLYIDDIDRGKDSNYAIYTKKGQNSLGDGLEIRNDKWIENQEAVFQFGNGKSKKKVPTSQIIDKMNGTGAGGSNLIFKTQSPTTGTDINETLPTEKMVIGADGKVKINDLAAEGAGTRNVVVDENGVLKAGEAGATQLAGTANMECNEANRGKMNFVKSSEPNKGDTFGICLKGSDNNFYWRYIYDAAGVSNGTGEFGSGLE